MDRSIRGFLAIAVLLGTGWVAWPLLSSPPFVREMRSAEWSLVRQDYTEARNAAERALAIEPDSPSALVVAGIAMARTFEHQRAIELLERIAPESRQTHQVQFEIAERRLHLGQVALAEQSYRRVLELDPWHLQANRRLSFLLQAEGRSWESQAFLAKLIMRGDFGPSELLAVASPERFFKSDPRLEQTRDGDLLIRLGEARRALLEGHEEEARPLLEQIAARYPDVSETRARLGRMIAESGNRGDFLDWNSDVGASHDMHPEIWFARGVFSRGEGQIPQAVRCFLETLLRAPDHLAANHQVSQCLLTLGYREQAKLFSDKVPLLSRLDVEVNTLGREQTPETADRVIRLLHSLGRHWEAAGWAFLAGRFLDPAPWSAAVCRDELRLLSDREGLTARESQPALQVDLQQFPLPDWSKPGLSSEGRPDAVSRTGHFARWRFVDEAVTSGINFKFDDGTSWSTRMRHVIETIGGGAGVIDFDRDGWPDLYFPQGNAWRQPASESTAIDRLFRNDRGRRFVDVTENSGLRESAFSHGVAVGDYDDDGWPDLYVANLGPNRFFHNNGDGTFTDVSMNSGTSGDAWSTSAALVDLTGDALPDLFVVNYLDLDFVLQHPCFHQGAEIGCTPDALPPASNRFYLNLGDGRFADASTESGVGSQNGNGLGLVVADFAREGRLSAFIGNDTTPNFLFRNTSTAGGTPRFTERGIVAGVAFDGGGSLMASMGIAAGDPNGDGLLDLFVTTYQNAADTLFLQMPDGSFVDSTRSTGLYQPTIPMLGFGAQFFDVDNDGWEDLVATNGHVRPPLPDEPDDERDTMPTQLFANLGGGAFAEVPAATAGEIFGKRRLGRGLCELDWNRDGRCDFCVSSIHSPIALGTNETPHVQHWLVVHLVGTTGSRDAFGTVVQVRLGNRTLFRQLTAGNGYLSCNERRLWFGLGTADKVDELQIHWPGGATQRFANLSIDQELLLIEGRTTPIALPR